MADLGKPASRSGSTERGNGRVLPASYSIRIIRAGCRDSTRLRIITSVLVGSLQVNYATELGWAAPGLWGLCETTV